MAPISYRTPDANGFNVFYRAAAPIDARKLLLLRGCPTAGHIFRELLRLLRDSFHLIGPLPGFGQLEMLPIRTIAPHIRLSGPKGHENDQVP
jgi:hypothetical protein